RSRRKGTRSTRTERARPDVMVATRQPDSVRAAVPRVCIAVDWCGAIADARKRMWLAEARAGDRASRPAGPSAQRRADRTAQPRASRIVRLECGRDRDETIEHLIECARREPRTVVGLDFAFSFPAWFLEARGVRDADSAWSLVDREGE